MDSIELFAGAGGLTLGVSNAGFTPIELIEWDHWCCETIRENKTWGLKSIHNWPQLIESDIRSLDFRPFETRVDIVTGGPPCQPFSLGGKHKAFADERNMWPEAVRVIREIKPKAFIFENVKGLTRSNFASYLKYIDLQLHYPEIISNSEELWTDHLGRLERYHTGPRYSESLNYKVVYRVLNTANYGIPQRRERVIFVGFRSDLGIEWSFPNETHSLDAVRQG
jgi:DNA (cytosine-5)-methyltransferase 1